MARVISVMGSKGGVGSLQHRGDVQSRMVASTVFNISLIPPLSNDLHRVFRWI